MPLGMEPLSWLSLIALRCHAGRRKCVSHARGCGTRSCVARCAARCAARRCGGGRTHHCSAADLAASRPRRLRARHGNAQGLKVHER